MCNAYCVGFSMKRLLRITDYRIWNSGDMQISVTR